MLLLQNNGFICYFNAVINSFLNIDCIQNYILNTTNWEKTIKKYCHKYNKDINECLIYHMYILLNEMKKTDKLYINIINTLKIIINFKDKDGYQPYSWFSTTEQNDACDILCAIINILLEETKDTNINVDIVNEKYIETEQRISKGEISINDFSKDVIQYRYFNYVYEEYVKNYSDFYNLLVTIQGNISECYNCAYKTINFNCINLLDYNIMELIKKKSDINLEDIMNNQISECLYSDSHEHKQKTGHLMQYSYSKICQLPKMIPIRIQRFGIINDQYIKLNNEISIPKEINMEQYVHRYFTDEKPMKYILKSFIVHLGSINSGHYLCVNKIGDKWFMISDSSFNEIPENHPIFNQAYIMFYEQE